MNRKAGLFLGAIVAIMVFMAGTLFVEFIKDDVTQTRTDLSCATPSSITDGTKVLCLVIGGAVPYYIIAFLSIAAGFIADKLI
jgi:small-conductance mechanosensitive channel